MNAKPDVQLPAVSVIMPVLDEERHLRGAVQAILAQEYAGEMEVVIALGPSTDRTDEIAAELVAEDPRVHTVPNPTGRTPAALNAAIKASRHPVVVRVDGHGMLSPNYIATAVRLLEETGAQNVGGIMHAEGENDWEHAVAAAMTSKIGVGNAAFHTGGQAGPAETVYLGVFRREALERQGGYNEEFIRAQDWELNFRIREAGGLIWFSPELRVSYRPRPSVRALAKQYKDYGRWRHVVARYHEGSINLRYLAPPDRGVRDRGRRPGRRPAHPAGLRDPRRLSRGDRRGLAAGGQGAAAQGPPPDPRRPRHHAHVVGLRLPHQPQVAGQEGHRLPPPGGAHRELSATDVRLGPLSIARGARGVYDDWSTTRRLVYDDWCTTATR